MILDLIASVLSMIIFENDEKSVKDTIEILENVINEKYVGITPNDKAYIIDKAYEIYFKM